MACAYFCRFANHFRCGQGELMLDRATSSDLVASAFSDRPDKMMLTMCIIVAKWSRRPATASAAPTDFVCKS